MNSYNKMTLEISNLIHKNVENEKSKRDAQIRALKSQINPHFFVQYAEYGEMDGNCERRK